MNAFFSEMLEGGRLSDAQALALAEQDSTAELFDTARRLTLRGHGRRISYSRKVFIPLTRLYRNTCGYCTFATSPARVPAPYLSVAVRTSTARTSTRTCACRRCAMPVQPKWR